MPEICSFSLIKIIFKVITMSGATNIIESSSFSIIIIIIAVVTQFLTHLFDKFFEKYPKIAKNNENPKKICFYIFASFLAFSTSSKKEFKFSKFFRMRSTFHVLF